MTAKMPITIPMARLLPSAGLQVLWWSRRMSGPAYPSETVPKRPPRSPRDCPAYTPLDGGGHSMPHLPAHGDLLPRRIDVHVDLRRDVPGRGRRAGVVRGGVVGVIGWNWFVILWLFAYEIRLSADATLTFRSVLREVTHRRPGTRVGRAILLRLRWDHLALQDKDADHPIREEHGRARGAHRTASNDSALAHHAGGVGCPHSATIRR